MTRLFIGFYVGVLIVLFLAWCINGAVFERRAAADRARVFEEAHGGGARLVARELDQAAPDDRDRVLRDLHGRFSYPVQILAVSDMPTSLQRQAPREDVAYMVLTRDRDSERGVVAAALSGGEEIVQLGPFPNYRLVEIENALRGWMRLTADKIDSAAVDDRQNALISCRQSSTFPSS